MAKESVHERSRGYWLLDSETANMVGYYETLSDALRDVADAPARGRLRRCALACVVPGRF